MDWSAQYRRHEEESVDRPDGYLQELLAAPARETWSQAGLVYAEKIRRNAPEGFEADLLENLAREKSLQP